MKNKNFEEIVKKHEPEENRVLNSFIAFMIGGFIGVLGQFLVDYYQLWFNIPEKEAATFMLVTLIFFASLFTALGFFDKMVDFARCGLIIPITGFAHSMTSAGIDYKKEGLIHGVGSNVFKLAGSVILYGVVSAYFFGILRLLIMGG